MVSLLLTVMAFEWKSYDDNELVNLGTLDADFEELQDIPITEQPPPPTSPGNASRNHRGS